MTEQHRRPLVIGLLASATCCTFLVAILFMGQAERQVIGAWVIVVMAFLVSALLSAVIGLPAALLLRKVGRLSVMPMCLIGLLSGAGLLGAVNGWSNYWPQMQDQLHAVTFALVSAGKSAVFGALLGLVSAIAFCLGAGVPVKQESRRTT